MPVLIIAEKPKAAGSIAAALGANVRHDGYFEGNNYIVTFAIGHLLQLYDMEDYSEELKTWSLEALPFFPDNFKYKVAADDGIKKQFAIIRSLVIRNDVEYVINAADDDREGELLSSILLKALNVTKPVKRLLVKELTPKDVSIGMKQLRDISAMAKRQEAGYTRQFTDWLIGINLTRAATVKCGNGAILRVGRALCPTVKLLYDRHFEIKNFTPEQYYLLKSVFDYGSGSYEGILAMEEERKVKDLAIVESIAASINGKSATVKACESKISKEGPKLLFNMTDLQGHITSLHPGWTSSKVLSVTQSLYEKRFVTYPRTPSRHLEETLIPKAKEVLEAITKGTQYESLVKFKESKDIFDSSKVNSHSALMPTYIVPAYGSLTPEETIVYEEIKKRFLSKFMPDAEYSVTVIETTIDNYTFISRSKALKYPGWKALYSAQDITPDANSEEGLDDTDQISSFQLPILSKGCSVRVAAAEPLSKTTTPPKHYTEQTLLRSMETCGKDISDDDMDNILKGFAIGTSATRGDILDRIQNVDKKNKIAYAEKRGKTFRITVTGIKFVEQLPLKELFDVNFTGQMEKRLNDIELGQYSMTDYIGKVKELVSTAVERISGNKANIAGRLEKVAVGKCPHCSKDIYEGDKAFYCAGFAAKDQSCSFVVAKENKLLQKFGLKKLTVAHFKKLLEGNEVKFVFNYTSFVLAKLQEEDGRWGLSFKIPSGDEKAELREVIGSCPSCSGNVYENTYGFFCENNKKDDPESCQFKLYKENKLLEKFGMKSISKGLAKKLLTLEKVHVKLGPTSNLYAELGQKENRWTINFEFPSKEENLAMREEIGKCPYCKKPIFESTKGFHCDGFSMNDPESCKFYVKKDNPWFTGKGKTISKVTMKALLNDGKAKVKGFKKKDNSGTYDATVLFKVEDNKYSFELIFDK